MTSCSTGELGPRYHCQRGFATLQRIASQIVAQVEGIEEDALVSAEVTDEIERSNAAVITRRPPGHR
jgi:hypothetical protein